jgi:type IV pilus assembly protein PilY1
MATLKNSHTLAIATCLFALSVNMPLRADDTEIYQGVEGDSHTPNVLFIIDTSGSMAHTPGSNNETDGTNDINNNPSKLTIVKDVFDSLIDNSSGINAALMRFDGGNGNNKGGYFLSPMLPLTSSTRDTLKSQVDELTAVGNTPLAETMYEAMLFFKGDSVEFGDGTSPGTNHSDVLDPGDNTKYKSPMMSECQRNYTILLTDGVPRRDNDADSFITTLTGASSCGFNSNPSDDCLDELTQYMYENDLRSNDIVTGTQNVISYTIGFDTIADANSLLTSAAENAGGTFHPAADKDELIQTMQDILDEIAPPESNNIFMAPSLALNAYNGLSHHNQLYFAQFDPTTTPKWEGNVKSYTLDPDETCQNTLKDANGNEALEPGPDAHPCDRYKIKETARSFWSNSADGTEVTEGGFLDKLPAIPSSRNVYTNLTVPATLANMPLSEDNIDDSDTTNTKFKHSMFGFTDAEATADTDNAELIDLIKWARGVDADGNARRSIGDPLHSQPVIVTYDTEDADNANMVMYVGTNEGFLHAIDVSITDGSNATSGDEKFAFIPKELLPNLRTFKENTQAAVQMYDNHPYGLDGDITPWIHDENNNGTIDDPDDFVYLYVGMRRGGKNYYALDVTDPDAPELMWQISGGSGDFTELGQTWSKPTLGTINHGGTDTKVLIFAGGYDENQDGKPTTAVDDSEGRALYIVNATTGERIWWAGGSSSPTTSTTHLQLAEMTNSIPSDVRAIDTDYDDLTDRIYVGDTRGQLFRFDIDDSGSVTGGVIAKLGSTGKHADGTDATAEDNRRFFYAPDVVLTRYPGQQSYLSINIGSGYRANPLNAEVTDRFYSIRDYDIFSAPVDSDNNITYTPVDVTELQNLTTTLTTADSFASLSDKGWYIDLEGDGEKVLAPSITFNGRIFFTSYTPPTPSNDACEAIGIGSGSLYVVSLFDAMPLRGSPATFGLDPDTPLTTAHRSKALAAPGIPPAPVIAFNPKPVPVVGTQSFPSDLEVAISKTYWKQNQ